MTLRILLVTPTQPTDVSFGSAQRGTLLYRALAEVGDVKALVLNEGGSDPGDATGPEVVGALSVPARPWTRRYSAAPLAQEWWRQNFPKLRFDLVVGRYLSQITMLGELGGVHSVADADDAYYRYARTRSLPQTLAAGVKSAARTLVTARALRRFSHVWFCSERDRAFFGLQRSSVLPNISASLPRPLPPPREEARTILIVGSMWYGPNRDAIEWFLQKCWHSIRAVVPDARLRIVGACSLRQRETWMREPGVECPGFVDDIAAEYANACCAIAPIRFGGGTQIKAVEAYAYGRPSIVSGFVYDGMCAWFREGESLLVARSPDEMVAHCLSLLVDRARGAKLAAAGRQVIENELSWDRFRAHVAQTLELVMSERPGS